MDQTNERTVEQTNDRAEKYAFNLDSDDVMWEWACDIVQKDCLL